MIGFSLDGESILMRLATLSTLGVAPDGFSYHLSEGAFAGWVGLLVTAINLLPIGQLDGGHILYGTARRLQHTFAIIALGSLFVLGFLSQMWWVFAVMGLIFGIKHPPTLNDGVAPSRVAVGMAVASLVIFGLSFTPIPFR
jgi:membrane-associated protease RseP (regulator of RpoE activity)